MKKFLKGAAAAALLTSVAAPALAQEVLVIDLDRVYAESAAGKSAVSQMQARFNPALTQAQTAFNTARTAYETQLQAAQKQSPTGDPSKLLPATRTALQQAGEKAEAAQNQIVQLNQAVQQTMQFVREQINTKVLPLAEQIRAEKKAAAVLVKGSILAADPAADVTSTLLPRLDAQLATVPIVPPQQPAAGAAPAAAAPAAPTAGKPATQGR